MKDLLTTKSISVPLIKLGYIDRLRVTMTVLVICHHAAVTYGAPGGWYMSDPSHVEGVRIGLTWFVATNQSFFMGFFFFLSALFTPGAYEKKGVARFIADRLKRLGLPLIFYSAVISPLTIWLVIKYQDKVSYSFFDFIKTFTGWIDFGVMWFVAALLIFTFAYVVVRQWWIAPEKKLPFPRRGRIVLFAVFIGLITCCVRTLFPVGWVLKPVGFQPAHFTQYIALYVLGVLAAKNKWLQQFPLKDNRFWLTLACGMIFIGFPGLYVVKVVTHAELTDFTGGASTPALLNAVWEQVTGFAVIMALTGLFKAGDRSPGPLLRAMTRSAYAVYIIHPVVLVSFTLILLHWNIAQQIKFFIVAPLAVCTAFLLGSIVVKIPGINRVV